jgi:hypothetical protein
MFPVQSSSTRASACACAHARTHACTRTHARMRKLLWGRALAHTSAGIQTKTENLIKMHGIQSKSANSTNMH